MTILELTDSGLYCPPADLFIDPWRPVKKAVITHAHSDHARRGMKQYLAHHQSREVMKLRLGKDIHLQTIGYGEPIQIQGVQISLHPAGHI
ncbi:MAG: DNA ligase-associated DEXH box helicase, partial [Bacteroidetes bacterium]|nr:DNA ligase-associated DEXH box helicase [Bacteroidota bacterium]